MRVTTWTEYSLIITLHLAKRGRVGERPIPARTIALDERLPADYTEQICLRLRRAGLVESVRGAKGGYRLAKEPATISVKDVMNACDQETFEVNCDSHPVSAERCAPEAACSIRPVWRALQQRVDDLLERVTLADLLRDEAEVGTLVEVGATADA